MLKMYKKVFMVKINKNVLTLKRSKNRSTSILGTAQRCRESRSIIYYLC